MVLNLWAAQHYKYKNPRTLLTSGGLGTMGYGLGASIGAKVGCKDKVVINIAGDGCFRMNMNEIATATRYNIPIIEIVFNNHVLGMVRQWQDLFYGKRYSATVLDDQVDFVKVSEGMGAKAYRVADIESFEKALKEAIELNIPCVIECDICKDDKVFPMVAPGAPISEAFDRDDSKTSRKFLRNMLEQAGHEIVAEAVDGAEGVEKFRIYRPDITTMDITMPVLGGIDAVKDIIEIDPDAKIIMVTAAGQKANMIEALKKGAADFIQKPFDMDVIVNTIEKVMEE